MTFSILGRLYSAIAIELWNALYKAQLTCRQVDSSRGGDSVSVDATHGALSTLLLTSLTEDKYLSSIQVKSKYVYTRV